MAELEIDQSHLPRVQEVRQSFAVLEDSVLAHSLQEQEIEHYYSSNIQKNQLVQNDMRVAKQLQGEEEQQREQQRAQLQQASQQLEEQDSEYARLIQEELQRCAEEARRRELEDEEIAKRIQEEEEQRGKSRGQEGLSDDADSSPAVPSPHQHTLGHLQLADAQHRPSAATRWQYSASRTWSDLTEAEFHRGIADRKETTPRSNEGHRQCVRRSRDEFRERLSEDSEDSDMVFYKELTGRSQRPHKRADSAPCHQWLFEREPRQRNCRSLQSERPLKEEHRGWPGDWRALGEDSECDEPEVRMPRNREWERNLRKEDVGWHGEIDHESDHRSVEGRARRCSRSQSVRLPDRQRDADATRTWSPREPPDRHVRFQDQSRLSDCLHDNGTSRVWEMLGQVLRERGVAVRHGVGGAPQPAPASPGPQSRHGQALHWSDASHGDPQPHPRAFDRSASTRHSYHGNARRCTPSSRMSSDCDYRGSQAKPHGFVPTAEDGGTVHSAVPSRDSEMANGERRGSGRWHGAELRHGAENGREGKKKGGSDPARGLSRSTSERWHQHKGAEELSPREDEGPRLRGPRRSFSLSGRGVSTRVGWRHAMAGNTRAPAFPQPVEGRILHPSLPPPPPLLCSHLHLSFLSNQRQIWTSWGSYGDLRSCKEGLSSK